MVFYIFIYFISCLCLYRYQRGFGVIKISGIKFNPYLFLGIAVPVCLAAFRDYSIGVDVEVYIVPSFQRALHAPSLADFLSNKGGLETLFLIMTYVAAKLTESMQILLGSYELLIICFTWGAFYRLKNMCPPFMAMLYFYLLNYNRSFSTVRQLIANALIFYAIALFVEAAPDKKYRFIMIAALFVIALGFHTSAVFGISIIIVYLFVNQLGEKANLVFFCGVIAAGLIGVTRFQSLLPLLRRVMSLLSDKYVNNLYYSALQLGGQSNTSYIVCTLYVIAVILILLRRGGKRSEAINWAWLQTMLYFNIMLLFLLVFVSQYSFVTRLTMYIQYLWPTILPQTVKLVKPVRQNRILINVITMAPIVLYWWFYYVHLNIYETVPYAVFG